MEVLQQHISLELAYKIDTVDMVKRRRGAFLLHIRAAINSSLDDKHFINCLIILNVVKKRDNN